MQNTHADVPVAGAVQLGSAEQKKQDRELFLALFPALADDVLQDARAYRDFDRDALAWFKEVRACVRLVRRR